ncbi:DNA helicase Pif1-like protein [Artemisia annua]|uniref:DNA helicase Pif1-like protein n=1 Tax=Artemisia annua TaxID=35608 RepID=A0A2U1ML94_ARTAN|nr:DNA helicase Pif1-like protein [Artemisia annua]
MKDDDITILELQTHLQTFRRKTKAVDTFVNTRQQPTFVDTEDWTQQMIYYFKERWEHENNPNINKPAANKRKKEQNNIGHKSERSKKQKKTIQKYTTWSLEMCKKFIEIVVKLGGCQDATPSKILEYMKDDNVTISDVQNHFKKFRGKSKRVDHYVLKNQQPTISETKKWSKELLYYFQVSCKSNQGTQDQTPTEFKGISKEYIDIGEPTETCQSCKAKLWRAETKTKGITEEYSFTMCCKKGEVEIPKMATPPKELLELYTGNDEISKRFFHDIRKFNMMYSFTSMGGKLLKRQANKKS